VDVADLDPQFSHVLGKILRGTLGKGRYQHTLPCVYNRTHLRKKVIYLSGGRVDLNYGIRHTGRPYKLFDHLFRTGKLIIARSGRYKERVLQQRLILIPFQRPVVETGGKPEPVFD